MPNPSFTNLEPIRSALAEQRVILTPTVRLARQIQSAWMVEQDGDSVLQAPRVMTLAAYQNVLSHRIAEYEPELERRPLSAFEAQWLFESAIQAHLERANTFTLLQPRKAAQDAYRCREQLLHWQIDLSEEGTRALFQSEIDCSVFLQWNSIFEEALRHANVGTQADRWRFLDRAASALPSLEKDQLVLFECAPLTPLEDRVLSCVSEGLEQVVARKATSSPTAYRFTSPRDELKAVAKWAQQRSQRSPEKSTAIVLLRPQQDQPMLDYYLREAFDCLDARYTDLPVNYSGGLALSKTPMYRDALLLLRAYNSGLSREDWVALLGSPYLDSAMDPTGVGLTVMSALFDLEKRFLSVADVHHACQSIDHPRARRLGKLLQRDPALAERCTATLWRERLSELLSRWNWPARAALDSVEYQQFQEHEVLFDSFEVTGGLLPAFDFSQAVELLEQILATHISQPRTEISAVQVLGSQEIRGMHFDAVWVVGATADALPQPMETYPFIPQRIQALYREGIHLHDAAFNRARDWLSQLLSRCDESFFSVSRYEGDVEISASVFLTDIIDVAQENPDFSRWRAAVSDFPKLIRIDDEYAGPLNQQDAEVMGGSAVLREQAICPFRSWASYRLGLDPLPPAEQGLTAAERGTLLHKALEVFGEQRNEERDSADCDETLNQRIESAVAAALAGISKLTRARVGVGVIGIERLRLASLLEQWHRFELDRKESFKIVQQEDTQTIEIAGLKLRLRVDRVDEFEDGTRVVVDYKSGRNLSVKDWFADRLIEPQLPLYSLLDTSVRGAMYAQVRSDRCQFIGVEDGSHLPDQKPLSDYLSPLQLSTWEDLKDRWRGQLENLAREYQLGWARATPNRHACAYCAFGSACRVAVGDDEFEDHDAE